MYMNGNGDHGAAVVVAHQNDRAGDRLQDAADVLRELWYEQGCPAAFKNLRASRLVDRSELGLSPLRIRDELEHIELLIQRAQTLERLLAELGKLVRLRKAVESQLDQTQRQRIVVPPDQCSGAVHERLRPTVREKREGRRPLIRGELLNTLAIRLPVAGPLVVHTFYEVLAHQQI